MAQRLQKDEVALRLSQRMGVEQKEAALWLDGVIQTLYEALAAGESVTLPGLGGFYVEPKRESWVFKFNPAQRLRAALGWSSTYKGER